jgi:hypothetical protein
MSAREGRGRSKEGRKKGREGGRQERKKEQKSTISCAWMCVDSIIGVDGCYAVELCRVSFLDNPHLFVAIQKCNVMLFYSFLVYYCCDICYVSFRMLLLHWIVVLVVP